MSAPVSLASMITSVQQRANIEKQTGFITIPEIRSHINEYCSELWDLLVQARAQEHKRKTQVVTTASGQQDYPLQSDFYQLNSVDLVVAGQLGQTNQQTLTLKPFMESERNMFRLYPSLAGWYLTLPCFYRILGTPVSGGANVNAVTEKVIRLIATPQSTYVVGVNYYPVFVPFATAGATIGSGADDNAFFDGINGWESFVVWGAVSNCKAKLKEDFSYAVMKVGELKQRIQSLADQNDAGNAERVHDVAADYNTPWWSP